MSERTIRPTTILPTALCVAAPLLAGLWCALQWRDLRAASAERVRLHAAVDDPADIRRETEQWEARRTELADEAGELGRQLKDAQDRLMPLTAEARQRMILDVLNLAARCGVRVEESSRLDGGPSSAPAARKRLAALLRRFPPDMKTRPLLRIEAGGEYAAIARFLGELGSLRWSATPVRFEIGRRRTAAPVGDIEDAPSVTTYKPDGPALRLMLVVAL